MYDDIPSLELTYPIKKTFEDDFPFPKVGHVSSLEGMIYLQMIIYTTR